MPIGLCTWTPTRFTFPPTERERWQSRLRRPNARVVCGHAAVRFQEFTFIPTRESPDHEHPNFQQTMRFYYPFVPSSPHLLRAWKKQTALVDLASSGGHHVRFPDLRPCPTLFSMRHYQFLSIPHVVRKYVMKRFDSGDVEAGWHSWRLRLQGARIELPASAELRPYRGDDELDASAPRQRHYLDEMLDGAGRQQEN